MWPLTVNAPANSYRVLDGMYLGRYDQRSSLSKAQDVLRVILFGLEKVRRLLIAGKADIDLHLPERRHVSPRLNLGTHQPIEWVEHVAIAQSGKCVRNRRLWLFICLKESYAQSHLEFCSLLKFSC
jgi:hypothetical protein